MSQAVLTEITKQYLRKTPELKPGYTVRIHQRIKEGDKERVQIFEGLIIKMNGGKGVTGTITVRKISEGVGVEKIFPIHSPNIVKIEVKKIAKVRRSKLYYMRELSGKSARLKEKQVNIVSNQELLHAKKKEEPKAEEATPETNEAPAVEESTSAEATADKKVEAPVVEEAEVKEEEVKVEAEVKEEVAEKKDETPAETEEKKEA